MKRIVSLIVLLAMSTVSLCPGETVAPITVQEYGNPRILRAGAVNDAVELEEVLPEEHAYAIGTMKDAEGAVTVIDDKVWINHGSSGLRVVASLEHRDEEVMHLYAVRVEKWQKIVLLKAMTENELYPFIMEQAAKAGLNTRNPFPFLIEGIFEDIVWSVPDGVRNVTGPKGNQTYLHKLIGYKDDAPAVIVGVYLGGKRKGVSRPAEAWRVHVVFKDENTTGQVNTFIAPKGATIGIPVR